jgi:diadenosine tetraphosphate (Ap4A) HIT family hydrolase
MKSCNGIYEKLATGELPSRKVYENAAHGLMVLLDPMPVAEGHLEVVSFVCAPSVDAIDSRTLHNKITTVAQYAGKVLEQAYPEAPYIGELMAHNQIRHPHIHRFPGDEEADGLKRFSKHADWPRLKLSPDHLDDIQGQLTSPDAIQDLWQACDAEVIALGAPDDATVQAIQRLGLVMPGKTTAI